MNTLQDVRGIYQIKNALTGECYIGVSNHVFKRLKDHLTFLTRGSHINKLLESSWTQYGPSAFTFSCVEVVEDEKSLPAREIFWINKTNALNSGFNRKTDQFKNRTLLQVGSDLKRELESLQLGSMNQTIRSLVDFYNSKAKSN